jgi:hypothetical protein
MSNLAIFSPPPFDAANDFLSGAPATFLPTAFDSHHGFFPSRRSARHRAAWLSAKRRGKCHAQNFPFSRSLTAVLVVTSLGDSGGVDG